MLLGLRLPIRPPWALALALTAGLALAPSPARALGVPRGFTPAAVIEAATAALAEDAGEGDALDESALDQPAQDDSEAAPDPTTTLSGLDAGAVAPGLLLPDLSVLVAEPVRGVTNSGFGWRDDPIRHRRRRFHRGADFRAPHGTPVYVAAAGEVAFSGRRRGYGRSIDVRHGVGLLTRYAHLSRIEVARGDHVDENTVIGLVGSTGRSTGPHLHFEVRVFGHAVDPDLAVRIGELQRLGATLEAAELAEVALQADRQRDPERALASTTEHATTRKHPRGKAAAHVRHAHPRPPRIS